MFMPQPKPIVYISAQQFYDHITSDARIKVDDDTRILMKLSKAYDSIAWCCLDTKNMVGTGGSVNTAVKALSAPGTIPAIVIIATYYTMRGFGKRLRQESMTHWFLYAADNQIYDSDWATGWVAATNGRTKPFGIKLCDIDMSAVFPPSKRKFYYNLMLKGLNSGRQ